MLEIVWFSELTQSAILWSLKLGLHKMVCWVNSWCIWETMQFRGMIDYILLLIHLSNHFNFITDGFISFSWTNSTDPRQRVPLINVHVRRLECLVTHCHAWLVCLCINYNYRSAPPVVNQPWIHPKSPTYSNNVEQQNKVLIWFKVPTQKMQCNLRVLSIPFYCL